MNKLTAKQERFVSEYLIDLNATRAAIRAGYAKSGASVEGTRLLANAKVAAAVQKALEERAERTEVTQDYVLTSIKNTMEQCMGTGQHSNPNAVLKGAELLGRHLAMFTDKKTVTHHDGDRLDALMSQVAEARKTIGSARTH